MLVRFLGARKAKRRGTNATVDEETEEETLGVKQREHLSLVEGILTLFDANQATPNNVEELFSPNADINFTDIHMNVTDLIHETKALQESFPDLGARWDEIVPLSERDMVVIDGFVLSGTHTGQPYAFGPFPAVPTKGAFCRNDPERLVFRISCGKIQRIDILSSSEKTGPQGFYRQLGGFPL